MKRKIETVVIAALLLISFGGTISQNIVSAKKVNTARVHFEFRWYL